MSTAKTHPVHKTCGFFKGFSRNGKDADGRWIAKLCNRDDLIRTPVMRLGGFANTPPAWQSLINIRPGRRRTGWRPDSKKRPGAGRNPSPTQQRLGQNMGIPPAGAYLLDNFYSIRDELHVGAATCPTIAAKSCRTWPAGQSRAFPAYMPWSWS